MEEARVEEDRSPGRSDRLKGSVRYHMGTLSLLRMAREGGDPGTLGHVSFSAVGTVDKAARQQEKEAN